MAYFEKRMCERKIIREKVIYSFGKAFYSGYLLNVSREGMFVETAHCLPVDAVMQLIIKNNDNFLNLLAKVIRLVRNRRLYAGMGLQLVNSPASYREYVNNLEPVYKS